MLNEQRKTHKGLQEGIIGAQERNIDAGYDGSDLAGVSRRSGLGREAQGRTGLNEEQRLKTGLYCRIGKLENSLVARAAVINLLTTYPTSIITYV